LLRLFNYVKKQLVETKEFVSMQVVKIEDARVEHPEKFTVPPGRAGDPKYDGICWACLFDTADIGPSSECGDAKYGVRAVELECGVEINWDILSQLRVGPKHIGNARGARILKSGDRVVFAIGPENQIPECTIYEIRE
jgi:hypothetical protein